MTDSRKALNRWARQAGYADFDTYIRCGHSVLDAGRDIAQRIRTLQDALKALPVDPRYLDEREPLLREPVVPAEAEPPDPDPPDVGNAHIQGADEP